MNSGLPVRVTPRSSRNAVIGDREGVVAIRLTAPPVDGAANQALLAYVAEIIGVAPRCVHLVRGARSRQKWIAVDGLDATRLREALLAQRASDTDQ